MSRDVPDNSFDMETISWRQNRRPVCGLDMPTSIEARVISTQADYSTTGQNVLIDPENGFLCENSQNDPNCEDYEERFCCPSKNLSKFSDRAKVMPSFKNYFYLKIGSMLPVMLVLGPIG